MSLQTHLIVALLLASAAGCGSSPSASYSPDASAAKEAVNAALSAWKAGSAMASIALPAGGNVQPQDSDWKAGKKLISFTLGAEKPTTDGPTLIEAKLTLAGSNTPIDVVYHVVGRDPLWVFRDRDYQKATGM